MLIFLYLLIITGTVIHATGLALHERDYGSKVWEDPIRVSFPQMKLRQRRKKP